ncbi:MAG: hypothetical protein RLZZ200_1763 [Pseudomonadota bacterium]|jgi:hypothetical protein
MQTLTRRLLCATLLLGVSALPAQEVRDPPKTRVANFDRRDLSGTWDRYPLPLDAHQDTSVVPPPPDIPPPPLKPEFKAAWEAHQKKVDEANKRGEPIATGYTHCIPDGMPAMMMAMFPMEVLQTKRQVTIIQEAYNQIRRIYLNDTLPAVEDAEPGFWGHSAGRWEGDTFVVETVGIKPHVQFRNTPHSADMRIHERMRRITPDHFENMVTVTDPAYLAKPWQWKWVYQRRPNYKMFEYVCEDNREYADPETGAARMRLGSKP